MTKRLPKRTDVIETTTLREFTGGLNAVDTELNMSPKFATRLANIHRGIDGSLSVRYGTKLFTDVVGLGSITSKNYFVAARYFNNFIIAIVNNGEIVAIDGTGTAFLIWSHDIAFTLPFNPFGWSSCTFGSFSPHKSHLVAYNGIDQPVTIDTLLRVDYLQDLATGSNTNVPVARFGVSAVGGQNGYLVLGGVATDPSTIYIGAADTLGTFEGDPAPNDGVNYDLSTKVPSGSSVLRGLSFYRNRLIAVFDEVAMTIVLGQYNSSNEHVPEIDDILEDHGSNSHNSMVAVSGRLLMSDSIGIPAVKRATLGTTLEAERASELVAPLIRSRFGELSQEAVEDRVFAINNRRSDQYMLAIPNASLRRDTTRTDLFVYTVIPKLKVNAWSYFYGWKWDAGLNSAGNNVFFTRDTRVYLYGNQQRPYARDYIGEQETFADDTVFTDGTGWSPVADEDDSGVPIPFEFELPWADFGGRRNSKKLVDISFDTEGEGLFTAEWYVDRLYESLSDPGEEFTDGFLFDDDLGFERYRFGEQAGLLTPALSMEFVGGDHPGFGAAQVGEVFGGGRSTANENLYKFPAKYKIGKLRISGDTMEALKIVGITFGYKNLGATR